ncbi:MAG: YggS family pyridoxal phosphate-dependent enzyme [Flavobacteriaceae bacterium]|tara:strand:- start:167 stop:817 length:651 start_codon:yes stop_codon:yes gene_type:complete
MNIKENLLYLLDQLPKEVKLVAVSKTKPNEAIFEAYKAGHRIFGENKVQEMISKYEVLPKDIQWHMIGHVQSNKVKYMAPFVTLIHGVDSLKLLKEINKQALKNNRVIDCLLQLNIANESTKFGLSKIECIEALIAAESLENVTIKGLMGMATFTDDNCQIEQEFNGLKELYDQLAKQYSEFEVLSMGMSGDYEIAITKGSNMIRVGSKIFGERNY